MAIAALFHATGPALPLGAWQFRRIPAARPWGNGKSKVRPSMGVRLTRSNPRCVAANLNPTRVPPSRIDRASHTVSDELQPIDVASAQDDGIDSLSDDENLLLLSLLEDPEEIAEVSGAGFRSYITSLLAATLMRPSFRTARRRFIR